MSKISTFDKKLDKPLWQKLPALWLYWLTEPLSGATDLRKREYSRLLSLILVVVLSINILSLAIQEYLAIEFSASQLIEANAVFLLALIYGLNRTGQVRAAGLLTCFVTLSTGLSLYYMHPDNNLSLGYICFSIAIASIVFNLYTTILIASLGTALTALISINSMPFNESLPVLVLLSVFASLVIIDKMQKGGSFVFAPSEDQPLKTPCTGTTGIFDWNPQLNKLFISPALAQHLGIHKYNDRHLTNRITAIVHPQDWQQLQTQYSDQRMNPEKEFNGNIRLRSQSGDYLLFYYRARFHTTRRHTFARLTGELVDISEYNATEEKRRQSEQYLQAILRNMQDVYYRVDNGGIIVEASEGVANLLGYERNEVLGMNILNLYTYPEERLRLFNELNADGKKISNFEARLTQKSGQIIWVSTNAAYVFDSQGNITGVEGTTRNITAKKKREFILTDENRLLNSLFNLSDAMLAIVDRHQHILTSNQRFKDEFPYNSELGEQYPLINITALQPLCRLLTSYVTGTPERNSQLKLINAEGIANNYLVQITPLYHSGPGIAQRYFLSITEQSSLDQDVEGASATLEGFPFFQQLDRLTGLLDRRIFSQRVNQICKRLEHGDRSAALFVLDIDRFRTILETLGHDAGDHLLQIFAARLRSLLPNHSILSKFTGDLFAAFTPLSDHFTLPVLTEMIMATFNEPVVYDGHSIYMSASIGVALFTQDGRDYETLFSHADMAMQRAKFTGGKNIQFYANDMSPVSDALLAFETRLVSAWQKQEFTLAYQPIVDTHTGNTVKLEALLRWHDATHGDVAPSEFITLLDKLNLMTEVGEWVIGKTLQDLHKIQSETGLSIVASVNVTNSQLKTDRLINFLRENNHKAWLKQLELEITEHNAMENLDLVSQQILNFQALGIRMAIDDFGTGYSSLHYLKKLPVQCLKIDKSFIRDIIAKPKEAVFINAIQSIAEHLNLEVVVEGVETAAQLELLKKHHVDYVQGNYICSPQPIESIINFLNNQKNRS